MESQAHHNQLDFSTIIELPFFFVVGSPRSGTTLLQQMLDANPQIKMPIESRWVVTLYKQFAKKRNWDDSTVKLFMNELYKDDAFRDFWNIDRTNLEASIQKLDNKELNFSNLVKLIYMQYPSPFEKSTVRLIGDKNPPYSLYIDILMDVFPTAKFVHIVRDYRPNIVSNRRWFIRKDVASLACKWMAFNKQVEQHKARFPAQFFTINYERLVNEPENALSEICDFLNLAFDPRMLDYHTKSKDYKVEGRQLDLSKDLEGIHEQLSKPVTNKNLEKWRKELTNKEIALADYIAGDFAAKYGYKKEYNNGNFGFWVKKLKGKFSVFIEVFIKRTYHKYINIKTRRAIRVISRNTFKLLGVKNIFHPEGLKLNRN